MIVCRCGSSPAATGETERNAVQTHSKTMVGVTVATAAGPALQQTTSGAGLVNLSRRAETPRTRIPRGPAVFHFLAQLVCASQR